MEQLQERVYTKAEIADFLGINVKDKNFKRNVENILNKWGYCFEYPPYSKTITITYVPEGENKLAEILIREYGIDTQVDSFEFACFLHAFNYVDNYDSMPWGERARVLKDIYGVEVCDKTLRNWANKLLATNALTKIDSVKSYWRSYKISQTETIRETANKEDYIAFFKYRYDAYIKHIKEAIIKGDEDLQNIKSKCYTSAHIDTMNKFGGWCYYSCKSFMLSAFDDKYFTEIMEIVNDIAPIAIEYKQKEDLELLEIRKQIETNIQNEINSFIF